MQMLIDGQVNRMRILSDRFVWMVLYGWVIDVGEEEILVVDGASNLYIK